MLNLLRILPFIFLFNNNSYAQNISGEWTAIDLRSIKTFQRTKDGRTILDSAQRSLTININKKNHSVTGKASIDYPGSFNTSKVTGKADMTTNTMTLFAGNTTHKAFPGVSALTVPQNKKHYNWIYYTDDTFEYLLLTISEKKSPINAYLNPYMTFKRPASPTLKKDSSFKPHPVFTRKDEVFKTIKSDTTTVKLQLYDNAEIDGDSVSVFLNNKLLAANIALKSTPFELDLQLDPGIPVNKLVVYADNLGSIPPNTAFMTVTVREKVYRLTIKSDESSNGSILFDMITKD